MSMLESFNDRFRATPEMWKSIRYREALRRFYRKVMAKNSLSGAIITAYSSLHRVEMNTPADDALVRTRRVHRHH